MVIRRGGRQDVRFLRDMLHHAYYWRERNPANGPGPAARYIKGWGRPGDTVLIAVDDAFPVGAAWYRLFRREQPGYGFVDEETPELAIAVVPNRRGRGIGDALIEALSERARADGYDALSLSVERGNVALETFYAEHGFVVVGEGDEQSVTMRRDLSAGGATVEAAPSDRL
jgi:GNAT superfamily N-acetyltransferase